ncbi:hypothetical protein PVK06_031470 [Gossypium arboreum]|uniref:Uncharacterized protein n=1 Tax=Gossypium arboreum TaxID=29729 RepID=A0ABR0NR83_GOSAR|nr:hypothetical protein PVK06_031470 [Gossypium arboreum]
MDEIEVDGNDYTGTNALDLIRIPNIRSTKEGRIKQKDGSEEEITVHQNHTEEEISKSGILDGENARKRRASIITTGIKRRTKGGGGNGGNTSGSTKRSTANTAKSMIRL